MKVFGKELFNHKVKEELYDFAKHGLIRGTNHYDTEAVYIDYAIENAKQGTSKKAKKKPEAPTKTPKEVYQLESLNDADYKLNVDREYIENQIVSLSKKRDLLPEVKKVKKGRGANRVIEELTESYGASKYGRLELESIIERLENRKKFPSYSTYFSEFPYTTSALINEVLKEHSNLKSKRVEEFIPDLPDEAIDKMTHYNKVVQAICGKDAVFYIIADKKDFGEVDKKRDPILLAQSPFALAWQILGAWDEEMIYLGDL